MNNQSIETKLMIPAHESFSQDDITLFTNAHNTSENLMKNQLNILGIQITETETTFSVKALIRSTVEKPIHFTREPTIVLIDDQQQIVAKQSFNLSSLHPIQPNTAHPYTFIFHKRSQQSDYVFKDSWVIAFDQKKQSHHLDLTDSPLSETARKELQQVIDRLGPPKENEVNIVGLSIKKNAEEDIQSTVLIRNGTNQPLNIKQLPLQITGPNNEIITQGTFPLQGLIVQPQTSKPASFVFPRKSIQVKDIDLTTCKITHVP